MSKTKRPKPFSIGRVRVRVHSGPREDGRWRWRSDYPDGRGGRVPVWSGWGSREEAEAAVLETVTGSPTPTADLQTVCQLMAAWYAVQEDRQDIAPSTLRSRRSHVRHLRQSTLRGVHVERVDRRTLERYRDQELRLGRAPSTVREDLRNLRQAWLWGREVGAIPDRNLPSVAIKRKEQRYSRRTPTRADVLSVLDDLREVRPWAYRAVYLAWCTGARKGEVASLRWESVDVAGCTVTLTGKTGTRTVPLAPRAMAEVASWPRERDTVHGMAVGTVVGQMHAEVQKACDRAGIERFPPHGLRRAAVDALYRGGQSPEVAAAVLGHSPATALKAYRQVAEADMAAAVAAVGLGVVPDGEVIDLSKRRKG